MSPTVSGIPNIEEDVTRMDGQGERRNGKGFKVTENPVWIHKL